MREQRYRRYQNEVARATKQHRMKRVVDLEDRLLDPQTTPDMVQPLLEILWNKELIEQRGAEAVLKMTRGKVEGIRQERRRSARTTTAFGTNGSYSVGDLDYALVNQPQLRRVFGSGEALEAELNNERRSLNQFKAGIAAAGGIDDTAK